MPPFGHRVIGKAAFAAASAAELSGAHKFGPRVRGASAPATSAIPTLKSPAGKRVQDADRSIALDELEGVLAGNSRMIDDLFEVELARPDGARPAALAIFRNAALVAGKLDIVGEVDELGKTAQPDPETTHSEPPKGDAPTIDLAKATVAQLTAFVGATPVTGTGKDGKVLRADLVKVAATLLPPKE